ncbi:lipopolysaccharide biosynthesis protein [Erythrobacter sp. SDW2]|uniref:lipopolysaccharide biosynthesis protein n=1 Tax=Erythrobacter sp. SDW2 TaxID=2907154 RepID=UPI001F316DE3|nr:lipopolysaccharide biosynthesis protein [Erythrobacter sp. SDW2]UIP06565.1 lipopolysaccharide biosynthesis protein [Erythrobacter sp. SDW2]
MGLGRLSALLAPPERQAMALQLVGAGFAMLAILVLARGLGATMAGHYAAVSQTVLFAGIAAIFGYDQALTRAVSGELAQQRIGQARAALRHYGGRVALGVIIAGVIAALASPHLEGIAFPPMPGWFLPLAVLAFALLRMTAAALRGAMHMRMAQGVLTLQPAILLALFVLLWGEGWAREFEPLGDAYMASLALAALFGAALLWRVVRQWPASEPEAFQSRAPDAYSMGLAGLIIAFTNWAEIAALGLWTDAASMGVFRVCVQLLLPFQLVYSAFAFSVSPLYAQMLAREEYHAVWERYRADRQFLLLMGGAGTVAMVALGQPILGFLGEEFRAGLVPLAIMASSLLLNLYTATSGIMLTMAHREDIFRQLTIASLLSSVLCILLLVPQYGMLGTAISVALGVVIREGGAYIAARRIIPGHK